MALVTGALSPMRPDTLALCTNLNTSLFDEIGSQSTGVASPRTVTGGNHQEARHWVAPGTVAELEPGVDGR